MPPETWPIEHDLCDHTTIAQYQEALHFHTIFELSQVVRANMDNGADEPQGSRRARTPDLPGTFPCIEHFIAASYCPADETRGKAFEGSLRQNLAEMNH